MPLGHGIDDLVAGQLDLAEGRIGRGARSARGHADLDAAVGDELQHERGVGGDELDRWLVFATRGEHRPDEPRGSRMARREQQRAAVTLEVLDHGLDRIGLLEQPPRLFVQPSPGGVSVTPREERSSSRTPATASRDCRRFESAGCETCMRTAARPSEPRSAAAQKLRSSTISGARTSGLIRGELRRP